MIPKVYTEKLLRCKIDELSTMSVGCFNKNFQCELAQATTELQKEIIIRKELKNLIDLYEKTNFLYPEKKERILDYMTLILDNWYLALTKGDEILSIIKFIGNNKNHEQLTTISFWRTTNNSWIAQHLCSTGFSLGVCAMMLKSQAEVNFERYRYRSFQNWFSKSNHFANSVFGTLVKTIGKQYSSVKLFQYIGFETISLLQSYNIRIVPYDHHMQEELFNFYCKIRGKQDAEAEEFDTSDIELDQLDQVYQSVNLRRRRFIWMAYKKNKTHPIGVAVANRGPFGFNMSLIENRCDLLIDPALSFEDRKTICHNLLVAASSAYFETNLIDYPISYIPVVTDKKSADILLMSGATFLREYNKSVWLRGGYEKWYNHIQEKYTSFFETMKNKYR